MDFSIFWQCFFTLLKSPLPYFTTIVALRSVFPAEFDPRTVKGYVPVVVGVPVMAAVVAFNNNPGGRLPDTMEKVGAG